MAESSKGGGGNQAQSPKEMSMEMRLLLAFLLMGAVMLLSPYFLPKSPTPAPGKKIAQTSQPAPAETEIQTPAEAEAQTPAKAPAATPQKPGAKAAKAGAKPGPVTSEQPQPAYIVDTDLF